MIVVTTQMQTLYFSWKTWMSIMRMQIVDLLMVRMPSHHLAIVLVVFATLVINLDVMVPKAHFNNASSAVKNAWQ